jgi:hypothetical protein
MNEFGEKLPRIPSEKMVNLGSNSFGLESIKKATPAELLSVMQKVNIKNFFLDQREELFDHIHSSYGYDSTPHTEEQATLYAAIESLKWVSEKLFDEYPYKGTKKVAGMEIHDRISKGVDVLSEYANDMPLDNTEIVSANMSLAIELQSAFVSYDDWASRYGELAFGEDEHAQRVMLVVFALTCAKAIQENQVEDSNEDLGSNDYDFYLSQMKFLESTRSKFGDSRSTSELGVELAKEAYSRLSDSLDERQLKEALWIAAEFAVSKEAKHSLLDKAYSETAKYTEDHHAGRGVSAVSKMLSGIGVTKFALSDFEKRLSILAGNLTEKNNLEDILVNHPNHVKQVVELHNPNTQDEIWLRLSERVIAICSGRKSHGVESFKISDIQAAFKQVASARAYDHAKEEIDIRFPEGR